MAIIQCEVCGCRNDDSEIFCKRCSSPISVMRLKDLSEDDLDYSLSALLKVFSQKRLEYLDSSPHKSVNNKFFHAFLNLEWLRPGSAIWNAILADLLDKVDFGSPLLDLGCGDGTFTSIFRGTEFDEAFDLTMLSDISKKDIYDYYEEGIISKNVKSLGKKVDVGLDIKKALLRKAQETRIYISTVHSDGHSMPFF